MDIIEIFWESLLNKEKVSKYERENNEERIIEEYIKNKMKEESIFYRVYFRLNQMPSIKIKSYTINFVKEVRDIPSWLPNLKGMTPHNLNLDAYINIIKKKSSLSLDDVAAYLKEDNIFRAFPLLQDNTTLEYQRDLGYADCNRNFEGSSDFNGTRFTFIYDRVRVKFK